MKTHGRSIAPIAAALLVHCICLEAAATRQRGAPGRRASRGVGVVAPRGRARPPGARTNAKPSAFARDDAYRYKVKIKVTRDGAAGALQLYRAVRRSRARPRPTQVGVVQKPWLVAAGPRSTRFWHQYLVDTLHQTDQPDRAVVLIRETLGDSVIGDGSGHLPPARTRDWYFDAESGALLKVTVTTYRRKPPAGWSGPPLAAGERYSRRREFTGDELRAYARNSARGAAAGLRFDDAARP